MTRIALLALALAVLLSIAATYRPYEDGSAELRIGSIHIVLDAETHHWRITK
jgi:hypothetical protein